LAGHEEEEENPMSVARNTEISVESSKSFDDAIKEGIDRATKTLRNVRGAWIKEQALDIEGDRITRYKVTMIVTFVLE
jgi:dodecin